MGRVAVGAAAEAAPTQEIGGIKGTGCLLFDYEEEGEAGEREGVFAGGEGGFGGAGGGDVVLVEGGGGGEEGGGGGEEEGVVGFVDEEDGAFAVGTGYGEEFEGARGVGVFGDGAGEVLGAEAEEVGGEAGGVVAVEEAVGVAFEVPDEGAVDAG